MILQDIKVLEYINTSCKKFGYWVKIKDYRKIQGKRARKSFIQFIEINLGPIGKSWTYQRLDEGLYFIKFHNEKDLLFFLLKANRD